MLKSWKERFSALSSVKGVSLLRQGLFDNVATTEATKLNKIQRSTPNIQLRALDYDMPVIEALVAVSWRDSIISIPRIIIPNTGREGYTVFALDEKGVPRKPIPTPKPTIIGFMDWIHLEDKKCNYSKSRWAILKAYVDYRSQAIPWPSSKSPVSMVPTPVFELQMIPDSALSDGAKNVQRSELPKPIVYHSFPALEVDPFNRYYEDILRRMGVFLRLGRPVSSNNLTRYYQFMNMKLGNFISMYSYVPNETNTVEPESPLLTIREQMESPEAKPKPVPKPAPKPQAVVREDSDRQLTLAEQLSAALPGVRVTGLDKPKKLVLKKR